MLPYPTSLSQPHGVSEPAPPARPAPQRIGVGIDTSRYGHYAAFLRDDLQSAAAELSFPESAQGYAQLRDSSPDQNGGKGG